MSDLVFIKNEADYYAYKSLRPVNAYKYKKVKFICSCCKKQSTKIFKSLTLDFLCTSCTIKNKVNNSIILEKKRQTCIKKYGVPHHNQSQKIQEKRRKTCNERYGVSAYSQTDEYKNQYKKTCQERYGTDNVFQTEWIKEKSKQTCQDKYGTDYYTQTEEYKKQAAETCMKKYGVDNYMKTDTYKKLLSRKAVEKYKSATNIISINKNSENTDRTVTCQCNKCNKIFNIRYLMLRARFFANEEICTYCNPINRDNLISNEEKTLVTYIKSIYHSRVIENDRKIMGGKELDIYLPDSNLAFEFDGLYWHNELFVDNNYHLTKSKLCSQKGIQLVHIFEDEWLYKKNIVKSRINSLFHLNTRIFARKCILKPVTAKDADVFLNQNHLQGSCISKYRYGLYYQDELVSLMTFGRSRFSNETELLRFCNKLNTNIIGGASRLFKHFLRIHSDITKIISFADQRWSIGNLYEKLGFNLVNTTEPSYYYIIDGLRHNRMEFQKHKLIKAGFNPNKTEHEIMLERKIYRIYDCGNLKYQYTR